MQMYLAARYSRNEEMREVAEVLRGNGHTVTSRWINGSHEQTEGDRHAEADENARFAIEDIEDLTKSDIVVSFTETTDQKKVKRPSKGGRHVEFGMGVAFNKRMVVIGPRECVFHWLPSVEVYDSLDEFLNVLEDEAHA